MCGESSGLGLYMVKQILDYLGHTIEMQSELPTTYSIGSDDWYCQPICESNEWIPSA